MSMANFVELLLIGVMFQLLAKNAINIPSGGRRFFICLSHGEFKNK